MGWELPRTQAETSWHHGLKKHRPRAPGHTQVSSCCRTLGRWHVSGAALHIFWERDALLGLQATAWAPGIIGLSCMYTMCEFADLC